MIHTAPCERETQTQRTERTERTRLFPSIPEKHRMCTLSHTKKNVPLRLDIHAGVLVLAFCKGSTSVYIYRTHSGS